MNFEVYCDESRPEVFSSRKSRDRYLLIGSLWLPAELRQPLKDEINVLRRRWDAWGEIKWSKVSPSRLGFFEALVDLFLSFGDELRFRCIVIDSAQLNLELHNNDAELGFYKFYYQLLHHWVYDFNNYSFFCDVKSSRDPSRLSVLRRCLDYSNLSSDISRVQSLPSKQVSPMQLADLLLGMASARFNDGVTPGGAKNNLICHLESRLGVERLGPTPKSQTKYNVFRIRLSGGW